MSESMGTNWQVEVFYDGECPLCLREIKTIRWMDRRKNIRFTDIADPAFRSSDYGKTMQEFMDEIQGRLPDGSWIIGVEVFRRLYAAVGLGPLVALTRVPGVSHGLDLGYRVFAKNRLRLTGRCNSGACEVR
jgi:predicted DCC family thiol-disulfide oxidoreductase YuxK